MNATRIGLDIAKQVFQVHGVDELGKVVLRKTLKRDQVTTFFANVPVCLIGLEAGGGSHYWARELTRLGHEVKLMAQPFQGDFMSKMALFFNHRINIFCYEHRI
ncbi:MAG: IS110 family transposase [Candidatus Competibacteraceae bacterium]|uniref:Transposase n=1 Tax=Candidatus Contendobacter odensis Run_B_J11 TaxID=1400861 RepID=A0A7U7GBL0_9GAMM|nr:IS110 family transposase [Candidatus Competibacteraceae bacterium]MBK8751145.1 IS110 family transposase [Candidatus Competibacteraceae bacterium]CDH45414.1 hypothetical protein BN874_2340009 [Candidatus Contendobacter odensis Run_B_J11]